MSGRTALVPTPGGARAPDLDDRTGNRFSFSQQQEDEASVMPKSAIWHWRLLAVAAAFTVLCALNYLFHRIIAIRFFDSALKGLAKPTSELSPVWPLCIYLLSAIVMVAYAAPDLSPQSIVRRSIVSGLWVGLLTFGTWNAMNCAWLLEWPVRVALVDTAWHAAVGVLSGAVAGAILGREVN